MAPTSSRSQPCPWGRQEGDWEARKLAGGRAGTKSQGPSSSYSLPEAWPAFPAVSQGGLPVMSWVSRHKVILRVTVGGRACLVLCVVTQCGVRGKASLCGIPRDAFRSRASSITSLGVSRQVIVGDITQALQNFALRVTSPRRGAATTAFSPPLPGARLAGSGLVRDVIRRGSEPP